MWNDREIKGLKPSEKRYRRTKSMSIGRKRGVGGLMVEVHPSGNKVFYFQYVLTGQRYIVSIGPYKATPGASGLTLEQASKKVTEYGEMLSKGVNVAEHLTKEREVEVLRIKQAKEAAKRGTFDQLLDTYLDKLEGKASHSRVKQSFDRYVRRKNPDLLKQYANEVTSTDIQRILKQMIQSGLTTQVNRTGSQLHAAFEYGIKQENDPRRTNDDTAQFNLEFNPVSHIPKQADYERVGEHVIADDDMRRIWEEITEEYFIVGSAIKLALATGQRAGELIRLKIEDFNVKDKYFTIPASVSKNRKDHIIPLNDLALEVVTPLLEEVSDASIYTFPGVKDGYYLEDTPIHPSTLAQHVRDYCEDYEGEKFVPRDCRRTWKTLGGKAGISKELRDRIQNHVIQDVSTKHYDKYDYFSEKQGGMKVWNDYLDLIIHPRKNVTKLRRA